MAEDHRVVTAFDAQACILGIRNGLNMRHSERLAAPSFIDLCATIRRFLKSNMLNNHVLAINSLMLATPNN